MATIYGTLWGLVITLSHDEVAELAKAEEVIERMHEIVGAIGHANPFVVAITATVALWVQIERALMIASDHGFGVYLLAPYATIPFPFAIFPLAVSPPAYTITSVRSGLALDVAGGSREDHAPIIQYSYHGGPNQQWQLVPVDSNGDSNGFVKIISRSSGKALDIPWATHRPAEQIQQYTDNGAANQQWSVVPVDPSSPEIVKIVSRSSGQVLDVRGGTSENSAAIQQYPDYYGATNQQWKLTSLGDPFRPY